MRRRTIGSVLVGPSLLLVAGCYSGATQLRTSALAYLYPKGSPAIPPSDVQLKVPVRVGVAFAPSGATWQDTFTEPQKIALLTRLADAFRGREGFESVQVIPSNYLSAGGSFDDLDRLAAAFGIDLVALVSYDQFQFHDSSRWSLAYLTIVGAYVIEGEENDTRTLMDATIFDIASRSMLFHATGQSRVRAESTPIDASKVNREKREEGFELAMSDLIRNLDSAVAGFQKQAARGTVRGPGTPKIEVRDLETGAARPAAGGAGALAIPELAGAALLALLGLAARRRRGAGPAA